MTKVKNSRQICRWIGCYHAAAGVIAIVFYAKGKEEPIGKAVINIPLCKVHQAGDPLTVLSVDSFANLAATIQTIHPDQKLHLARSIFVPASFEEYDAVRAKRAGERVH